MTIRRSGTMGWSILGSIGKAEGSSVGITHDMVAKDILLTTAGKGCTNKTSRMEDPRLLSEDTNPALRRD